MMMRRSLALLWIVLIWMSPAFASGQEQDKDQARKHFLAAKALEEAGNHEAAAAEYLKAYEYFSEPEFFYNAGRVYRLHGDLENAIKYFQKYLDLDPNGRAIDSAQRAIAEMQHTLEKEKLRSSSSVTPTQEDVSETVETSEGTELVTPAGTNDVSDVPEPTVSEDADIREHSEARTTSSPGASQHSDEITSSGSRSTRMLRISGLSAAGVGLVATILGIKYGLDARRLGSELSDQQSQWTDDTLAKFEEGERASTKSFVFTGVGAVGLIAGGVLYFLGGRSAPQEASTRIGWELSSEGVSFALTGSF